MSQFAIVTEESWTEPDGMFRAKFGIWVFMATEIMFFGGMFLAYAVLRSRNPEAFIEAGSHASFFFGTLNTVLLISSSFAMAVAMYASDGGDRQLVKWGLFATLVLGTAFLVVKGLEYREDIAEHLYPGRKFPVEAAPAMAFFALYWVMTGLHAVHLTIGLGIVGRTWIMARRAELPANFPETIEVSGLYWHLVDVMWMVIYALIYLVGR